MDASARDIIERLGLQRHPEGGWHRETWRAPGGASGQDGPRAAGTAIHFLLEPGQRSHWHRVDASEVWLHQAGGSLTLRTARGREVVALRLGPDIFAGDLLQAFVAPGQWQALTEARGETWALVAWLWSRPSSRFSGFELAPPGWDPNGPPLGSV